VETIMLKTILIVLVVAVAAVLVYAATRPDNVKVQRTARIAAPAEKIFPLINDMPSFNRWNPYVKKDPNMKGSYRGPASGPGAGYEFEGNKDVGKGSIEITASTAPGRVAMRLDMLEPFEVHNVVEFTLQPQGSATDVTWAMNGASPFMAKLFGLIFNMDKMVGKDFEAGLGNLKTLAEQP
jgi:uncharacterized protein YndB with AHSA1/START domain